MDKNLDAFLAVAKSGSLTEAADLLGVTQPSVTKRIANLETDFAVPLFERNRRGMRLTEAGELFLPHAQRIESEYRFSREKMAAIAAAGMSVVRVSAGPLFHLSCVASLFIDIKTRFPDLKLELETRPGQGTLDSLLKGEIDLYLGALDVRGAEEVVASHMVTEVEHGLVMRPDHPLAERPAVDIREFANSKWVIFGIDPDTEARIQSILMPTVKVAGVIDIRTTSFATGLQLVREGHFVMSAPLQLARRVTDEGLVILPTEQGLPRRSAGLHLRRSSLGYGVMKACLAFFQRFQFE